jgi:hypothetical protein
MTFRKISYYIGNAFYIQEHPSSKGGGMSCLVVKTQRDLSLKRRRNVMFNC